MATMSATCRLLAYYKVDEMDAFLRLDKDYAPQRGRSRFEHCEGEKDKLVNLLKTMVELDKVVAAVVIDENDDVIARYDALLEVLANEPQKSGVGDWPKLEQSCYVDDLKKLRR